MDTRTVCRMKLWLDGSAQLRTSVANVGLLAKAAGSHGLSYRHLLQL